MVDEFKTIENNIEAQIVEKKSKFIANIFHAETREEAEDIIKAIKKKYYDARHNCYAYRVIGEDGIIEKSSDDGEPSGTAGSPMLTIISKNNIANVVVIVTRYFGGILLGTGGLVKAYSEAVQKAIEQAEFVRQVPGYEVEVELPYTDVESFKYYCKSENIKISNEDYSENVKLIIEIPEQILDEQLEKITSNKFKNVPTKIAKKKNILTK